MDYKKIIAATAVTSAAFVVPAVVDAATPTPTNDLLGTSKYVAGDEITAPLEIGPDTAKEKIISYEWTLEYDPSLPQPVGKTRTFIIPQHAQFNNAKINLTVTTGAGNTYTQSVEFENPKTFNFLTYNEDGTNLPIANNAGLANQAIQANLKDLSPTIQFETFEWYIVEKGQSQLISDSKDKIIDVPLSAAGKTLRLVAKTKDNETYVGDLKIKELIINDLKFDIKLNGNSIPEVNSTIAPNDMLSVENVKISAYDPEDIEILNEQAIITYQWYYKAEGDIYSAIPDATGPTYLVPNNAFGRNLKNISVSVTVEIPSSGATAKTDKKLAIKLDNSYATTIKENIESLLDKSNLPLIQYADIPKGQFDTKLEALKDKVIQDTAEYNSLSANSKSIVTNYSVLQQATQDIKAVEALIKELDAFTLEKAKFDADPSELSHTKLVKQFSTIEKKYQKFDSYKRSLLEMSNGVLEDYNNNYIENMSQHLMNIKGYKDGKTNLNAISVELVSKINSEITALFDENTDGARIYTFSALEEESRAQMLKEIERLEVEIKKVERKQQAVINSSLLKMAKTDIKKADSVGEKIAEIDKATGAKKVKAILNTRTAFNKLTFMQQSLFTIEELAKFDEVAYPEEAIILELDTAIDELKPSTSTSYVFTGYSSELIKDKPFGNAIDVLLLQYKELNSKAKKMVKNYNVLKQAKKDLAATTKVVNAINKAIDAHIAVSDLEPEAQEKALKSVQSKYRSAYSAYMKLTLLQRSIVDQTESFSFESTLDDFMTDLEDLTELVSTPTNTNPDKEIQHDTALIAEVVDALNTLEQTVSNGTSNPTEILTTIKEIEVKYKALSSSEKKGVYNYSILSRSKTLANKASSVEETLTSAYHADSLSKMESAVKSYQKLTYGQKQMILQSFRDVEDKMIDLKPDLTAIENALAELKNELSLANILAVQELITLVDKKDLQKLEDYKVYQDALKIQKAVDSFLKKYSKLDASPTYSKKQSILKDFKKLTTPQLSYLINSYPNDTVDEDVFATLTSWEEGMIDNAEKINNEIGGLITVNGEIYNYQSSISTGVNSLTDLENAITELKTQYKALDAKERKLITHYSFLSKIERDIKAVRKAIDIKATANEQTFQQTYNRLTNQQQDLFNKATQ